MIRLLPMKSEICYVTVAVATAISVRLLKRQQQYTNTFLRFVGFVVTLAAVIFFVVVRLHVYQTTASTFDFVFIFSGFLRCCRYCCRHHRRRRLLPNDVKRPRISAAAAVCSPACLSACQSVNQPAACLRACMCLFFSSSKQRQ